MHYDQPVKRKKLVVKPDFKALGPRFKARATAVGEALKALSPEELQGGEMIRLNVEGETIEIEPALVSFESVDEEIRGEEVVPHVIEPSFGIDRIIYTVLDHSFLPDAVDGEPRSVLRFLPAVAPIEVAILPLIGPKGTGRSGQGHYAGATNTRHARGLGYIRIDRAQIPAER